MSGSDITANQIANHIIASVKNGTLATEPFPYLVSDDVLPPEAFNKLVTDLPSYDEMTPMSQLGLRNVARYDKHLTSMLGEIPDRSDPAVWSAVADALLDPTVENTLRQIFAPYVACATDQRELRRQVVLDCGKVGAYLEPHTDSPIVLMKCLLHVSPPTEHPTADTILYSPKDPAARQRSFGEHGDFSLDSYSHESADDHIPAVRVKFKPNRMWSFFRTPNSLHGLEPLAEAAAPRFIIAAHYKYVMP